MEWSVDDLLIALNTKTQFVICWFSLHRSTDQLTNCPAMSFVLVLVSCPIPFLGHCDDKQ